MKLQEDQQDTSGLCYVNTSIEGNGQGSEDQTIDTAVYMRSGAVIAALKNQLQGKFHWKEKLDLLTAVHMHIMLTKIDRT